MANLLFLAQRLPYPPDKGDKLRSFHLIEHLRTRHRVFVGTFIDDPTDEHSVQNLASRCDGLHVVRLARWKAYLRCLGALLRGRPLSTSFFGSDSLEQWVKHTVDEHAIDAVVVFSSSMARFAMAVPGVPTLVDFVDVDSDKWAQYALRRAWPMSWIFRREARLLHALERRMAANSVRSFFVTEHEVQLFLKLAPELKGRVEALRNGVDSMYFDPSRDYPNPFSPSACSIVFTGTMDHWPNIDAVMWFARHVLPALRAQRPDVRLCVVGRRPSAQVRALAGPAVWITGTVEDVRPYIRHATVVVAPLRVARGVQNKILEAMAMGRPVVAARACIEAIDALPGVEALVADSVDAYVQAICELLDGTDRAQAMGQAARRLVQRAYQWAQQFGPLDRQLDALHQHGVLA